MDNESAQLPSNLASMNLAEEMPPTPQSDFALTKYGPSSMEARTEGSDILQELRHGSVIHKKILSLFNESIAFAPNDSQELALAYNDRSIFLHHLKKYDQAIVDIDRALVCTRSGVLKAKLMCRKASCLNYVDRTKFSPVALEARICIEVLDDRLSDVKLKLRTSLGATMREFQKPLPEQSSEKVESLPNLTFNERDIEIKQNNRFGRHLISNADVEPGEIMMVQDAYALCPQEDFIYLVCSFCLNCAWNGIPCDTCPCVIYCSEDCKQKAWQKYHEVECSLLSIFMGDGLDSSQDPLLLRVIATALQEEGVDRKISNLLGVYREELEKDYAPENFTSGKFRSLCHMYSSHEIFPSNLKKEYKDRAIRISSIFSSMLKEEANETVDEFMNLVLKLAGIVQANVFPYQGSNCFCEKTGNADAGHKCKSMKMGMVLVANSCSLINHSCIFNVGRTMKNGKVIIFSTQPIAKGNQLFFTYMPTILEKKSKRQEHLQTVHWFTCTCVACVENWAPLPSIPEAQPEVDKFYEWKKKHMSTADSDIKELDGYVRVMPELKNEIKKIFNDNTTFKAEVKSHHYQSFLYDAMTLIYGTQITIPATCGTEE